ncbi:MULTISPECIES: MraY family glycosyltransferase [unclassified Mesobacillus]|uniref:glycosyltransferase family 4 protein n=1 Tax=unclassified Mesobacillus TaxID=2675270 RepID=UPI00203B9A9D|nr:MULTISPECIES: MraY family glycosyltransferase [unclassified Mesobacillus]MCM3124144.1 undecaprenyl/decaprenyl-phosphate alpha-N-acetylglucosaminyl 1-phosphate transferase [Mesobacillus sp. MER 33]MCM3233993.1 undecaprenyl/decaprenyl-phosphate alpha-N-acetylglucosaminyl 1-phosphate transferase [Mesobacillus sp. MER 48]
MIYLTLILCFICSILITPMVKKLAFRLGATDYPNTRKVHQKIMPRMGGLAIYISFMVGLLILNPQSPYHLAIIAGSVIILLTGIMDDIFSLSAKVKFFNQIVAALVVVVWGGIDVDFINLPFGGRLEFGAFSLPITLLWIVGVTNAINLIDGLDGLAAGVSSIALISISGMAIVMGDVYVMTIGFLLLASTLGFLIFNFHPAKIFMGDTGALFLGYMIAVLSLLGFKNVTFISFIIPVIMLGVPMTDTIFAIIRRIVKKAPLAAPDKSHLHHCLLNLGFTHRQTVLLIYAISAMFGLTGFIFSFTTMWGSLLILSIMILSIELIVESVGLVHKDYKPLLNMVRGIKYEKNR